MKIIDNIPIAKARELFEQGVKSTTDPLIAELRRKAWEDKDYQPTEEELVAGKAWIAAPDIILSEDQLQRIYEFPAGSVWDFFLAVLGVKKIPTTRERIEAGFEHYLTLYNFTQEQTTALRKIKERSSPTSAPTAKSISTPSSRTRFTPASSGASRRSTRSSTVACAKSLAGCRTGSSRWHRLPVLAARSFNSERSGGPHPRREARGRRSDGGGAGSRERHPRLRPDAGGNRPHPRHGKIVSVGECLPCRKAERKAPWSAPACRSFAAGGACSVWRGARWTDDPLRATSSKLPPPQSSSKLEQSKALRASLSSSATVEYHLS